MKTLLHFGAHKTASTSLQLFLSTNRKKLLQTGIYYVLGQEWAKSGAYEALKKTRGRGEVTRKFVDQYREFFQPRTDGETRQITLFSNEGVYGQHNLAKMGSLYPAHDKINQLFAEGTRDLDPAVVFFVRRQDTFLESTYLQTVHYGSYLSFYDYISSVDLTSLKWSPIVESLQRHFGRERVFVHPFEHIRQGFRHFLDMALRPALGDETETILDGLKFEGLGSRNRSFSEVALQVARVSYPLVSTTEDQKALRAFLQETFSNETHPRASLISPQFRKFLLQFYREDNRRLMELCGETNEKIVADYVENF